MVHVTTDEDLLRVELPGSLIAVDDAMDAVLAFLDSAGHGEGHFGLRLTLRECLVNAVRHGCKEDASQLVQLRIEVAGQGLQVSVEDPGAGFDWRACLAEPLPEPSVDHGRGLHLVRRFAQRLCFAEGGRKVSFHMPLERARGGGGLQDAG